MTEAEWLRAIAPSTMPTALQGRADSRRLRLYACACCRRLSARFGEVELQVLDLAERFADNPGANKELLKEAELLIRTAGLAFSSRYGIENTLAVISDAPHGSYSQSYALSVEWGAASVFLPATGVHGPSPYTHPPFVAERAAQADLLRCIFGNPFRPVAFAPNWRSETAVALAAGIYAERAFDRLPILADALEEAGCDIADVLNHCRGPGPHARGCWVADAVLGKS